MDALSIIKPGQPVPEGHYRKYQQHLETVDDVNAVVSETAMLDGLIHAFRKRNQDTSEVGRMLASAEVRIGELLGKPQKVPGPGRGNKSVDRDQSFLTPKQIHQFRKMAWPLAQ